MHKVHGYRACGGEAAAKRRMTSMKTVHTIDVDGEQCWTLESDDGAIHYGYIRATNRGVVVVRLTCAGESLRLDEANALAAVLCDAAAAIAFR